MPFTAAAYCKARMRLKLQALYLLLERSVAQLHEDVFDNSRWLGHRVFFVDGSSFSMPDTPVLQAHFGQPGQQQPGCGFPTAHWLALLHAGSGMITKILASPLRTHDMSKTVELHPELQAGDVLKELQVFALIYNLVRQVMLLAAVRQKVDVRRISFIDAFRWLQTAQPGDELSKLVVNPDRPNRLEPRVRKRRPKQYPLMKKPRRQLKKDLENK
jgi:hypothetical protein